MGGCSCPGQMHQCLSSSLSSVQICGAPCLTMGPGGGGGSGLTCREQGSPSLPGAFFPVPVPGSSNNSDPGPDPRHKAKRSHGNAVEQHHWACVQQGDCRNHPVSTREVETHSS